MIARIAILLTLVSTSTLAQTAPIPAAAPATPVRHAYARPTAKPANPNDYVIMKVNGEPVYKSRIDEVWASLVPGDKAPPFDQLDDKVKTNILRGVASEQLVYREAQRSGLADSPEVAEKLAQLKEKLVTQTYLEHKAGDLVSDAELHKVYDEQAAKMKGKEEVKARHILVDTEDKAEEIEKQLKDGDNFDDIAKKQSLDKSNAAKGGDLGWFGQDQMVAEFSKAAFALKKGEVSKPVKTSFGWHVIKLDDRRPVKLPSFDEVKDQLRDQMKAKALKDYVSKLADAANIQYFDKAGKPLELTRVPDSTVPADAQ